jgi:transcriptional regulator with XRE-family HTH domain
MVDGDNMANRAEITAQIRHIAERLREEREKLRISQMDLSFKAGLSQNQVNYIETGKRTPNLYTILSICNALQISPAVLFEKQGAERKQARETVIKLVSQFM